MRSFAAAALSGPPFPVSVNPHAGLVAERSAAWAARFGMISTVDEKRRLRRAEAGQLAGRACPHSDPARLGLLTDLFTWLFAFDDQCDDDGLGADPGRLAPVLARLLDVLDLYGGPAPADLLAAAGPAGRTLHDLCRRIRAQHQPERLLSFTGQLREYLLALLWEATNRERNRVPTVAEYVRMRRHTGAVHPCFTLTDLTHDVPQTTDWQLDPRLSALHELAADLVCWCNDLFSYGKERRLPRDGHNLVAVIAVEYDLDEQLALAEAADRFNAGLDTYLRLEAEVSVDDRPGMATFLTARRCWIRGTYDWSMRASRYR